MKTEQQSVLVTTLVIGDEMESLAKHTVPLMREYASRIGSDFTVLGKSDITDQLSPYYEKNQIYTLLDTYDKVLFIDCDILITPDAPSLFEFSHNDEITAVSVENVYRDVDTERKSLFKILGEIEWTQPYFNSGVVLFTAKHKDLLNTTDGLIEKWINGKAEHHIRGLNDQSIFNYRINKHEIPIVYIDNAFNFTKAHGGFERRFSKYFIHYAGMKGSREARIRIDSKIIATPWLYRTLRSSHKIAKIFDIISLKFMTGFR